MIARLGCLAAIGVLALHPAAAQTPLTLEAAQAEARAHAPDVAELDAVVRGAEAVAAQARRKLRQNPELSASIGPGALTGRPDELSWNLGAALPIDISGSWKSRTASADADVSRAAHDREDGLRALDQRVAEAVADLALQQQLVRRLARLTELQQIASDAAHRLLDVGQGTQLDADSADLDLAAARVAGEHGQADLAGARARLGRLIGRTTSTDLVVADPPEQPLSGTRPDYDALINRDPRVRAIAAELDAAQFERQMFERLVSPTPSFGLAYGYQRRDIPSGSFSGSPLAGALSAIWPDRELSFSVNVGVPLFDRQQEPRAKATARILAAETKLQSMRADVRTGLVTAWETVQAASRALQAVSSMGALLDRDAAFVEQAVRAGAFDVVQRTQALRRLAESGRIVDTTIRDFRAARAAWVRRTAP